MMLDRILFEDESCIVCVKPSGFPTQSGKIGQKDMVSRLKNYRVEKSEDSYLGVCHRLDQPVEGIMVFAKTKEAAAILSKQFAQRTVEKHYYALILGELNPPEGELVNFLKKDDSMNGSVICSKEDPKAKLARLTYRSISTRELSNEVKASLIDIQLETGRLHQIRLQFAHKGAPLIGDRKYGAGVSDKIGKTVALCSYQLEFQHPLNKQKMKFQIVPTNDIFAQFLQDIK